MRLIGILSGLLVLLEAIDAAIAIYKAARRILLRWGK